MKKPLVTNVICLKRSFIATDPTCGGVHSCLGAIKPINVSFRRIHITEETHKFLGGDYEVEEGHGGDRHPYLRDHNIKSFLVIPPDNFSEVSQKKTCRSSVFSESKLWL